MRETAREVAAAKIKRAGDALGALCKAIWAGDFREGWHWEIPANHEKDTDCIIGDGLEAGTQGWAEVARLEAAFTAERERAERAERELEELRERGDLIAIRCREHYAVPAQNRNEYSGGECGGCIAAERDALLREIERKQDATGYVHLPAGLASKWRRERDEAWAERNTLREHNAVLRAECQAGRAARDHARPPVMVSNVTVVEYGRRAKAWADEGVRLLNLHDAARAATDAAGAMGEV